MDINWTTILTQAIVTLGTVAVVALPLWRKQLSTHLVAQETKALVKESALVLDKTVKEVNGKLTQLIAAEKGQSKAEGIVEGISTQQGRQDALRGTAEDRKVL